MKNTVFSSYTDPTDGTVFTVQFESYSTTQVGIGIHAVNEFKRQHGIEPDINKISTRVG